MSDETTDWRDLPVCDGTYPEHDFKAQDERDGVRTLECTRCGAESWEEIEDGGAS